MKQAERKYSLDYLQTVYAGEFVTVSTFLSVVLLYRGFLQLLSTGITGEVNHVSSENTDKVNCMNSTLSFRLRTEVTLKDFLTSFFTLLRSPEYP